MKINYFVMYPDNRYEFMEKNVVTTDYGTEFIEEIEKPIGDYSHFKPLKDYTGYFVAHNDCAVNSIERNKLAECLTHSEEFGVCVLTKCYIGQACFNNEFETFNDDDKKYFELILSEQAKVINNEDL